MKRLVLPSLASYKALFVTYLGPQWRRATLMAVLLVTGIALQLLNPQILRYFVDAFTSGDPHANLLLAGALFIGVALATQMFMVLATYAGENVAWTATNELRADLLAHCLTLEMGFHKAHTSGEMIERIDSDVDTLSNFFSQAMVHLFGNSLLILGVGNALAFVLGASLWSSHAITLGTVYVIFYYTNLIIQPMEQIRAQLQDLGGAGAGLQRVQELLSTQTRISDGIGTPLPPGALTVTFDEVTFGYLEGEPVVSEVRFHVQAGKILGVIGRTGSGKTTLARLLLRLYDPQQGQVRVGEVPVREVRLKELRRRIGLVTQDVQLFHATVRDNLTFFDHTIDDARIIEVLEDLGLSAWYWTISVFLTKGYNVRYK
jgi:ABC-type multidrug transport system fused ATPase/permease subunit